VRHLDVAGAGGTSWVGVETHRAKGAARSLGEQFWDWGIPTAASLLLVAGRGMRVLASGGMRSGLDVVRALALGACAGGLAAPALRAQRAGGAKEVVRMMEGHIEAIRTALFLTGCRCPADMSSRPRILGPELARWADLARRGES
jgi:isopentenyl-diphosphate delta-isomerase